MRAHFLLRTATLFLATLASTGCGRVRYPTNYVLNLSLASSPVAAPSDGHASLAVEEFQCPQYLCEGRIVYRETAEEIAFYEFHRWAMNPREMVTRSIADRIRSESLFRSVVLKGTGVDAAYVLKGQIERLEELDEGRDVRVVCTISAQLLDTRTRSVVWGRTESQTVAVQNRNISGVVNSLSTAAQVTIDNLVKSLGQTLHSPNGQ
jgi:cholesterol transport system auxiliary component